MQVRLPAPLRRERSVFALIIVFHQITGSAFCVNAVEESRRLAQHHTCRAIKNVDRIRNKQIFLRAWRRRTSGRSSSNSSSFLL
jgi:hypothetical protein